MGALVTTATLRRQSGAAVYSVANYAAIASTFGSGIATARALGADGRGHYAAVVTAGIFLTVAAGLGICISFRRAASIDPSLSPAFARSAWRIGAGATLALIPIALCLVLVILGGLSGHEQVAGAVALVASGIGTIGTTHQQLLIAQQKLPTLGLLRLLPQAGSAATLILLALLGRLSLTTALLVLAARPVAEALLGWRLIEHASVGRIALRPHIHFGVRSLPDQIAELGSVRVDQLLLLSAVGPTQLGRYAVCVTLAGLPTTIGQSLIFKWFATTARGDDGRFADYARKTFVLMGACLGLGIPLALASPALLPALYGPDFRGLSVVIAISVASATVLSGCYGLTSFLVARGRPGLSAVGWFVSFGVSVAAVPAVAERWSIEGAAWLSLFTYILAFGILLLTLRRTTEAGGSASSESAGQGIEPTS